MFSYEWRRFDPRLGFYYMVGVLVVLNLAENVNASWTAAGVSALLAWLTVLLGQPRGWRPELGGLVVFLAAGLALSYLAHAVAPYEVLGLGVMFIVTFLGMMLMTRSAHAYMVSWCLVYWYLLTPLFSESMGLTETLVGHLIGAGVVFLFHLTSRLVRQPRMEQLTAPDPSAAPPIRFAAVYSGVVALTMTAGLGIGGRTLESDPTLISNSAFNVISPTASQTWINAVERMLFGTAGICCGFYLGVLFPGTLAGQLVIAVSSFLALALVRVSFGPVIGAFFIMISYPWGTMETEIGHAIANEKLVAELVGVILAGGAISILSLLWRRLHRSPGLHAG